MFANNDNHFEVIKENLEGSRPCDESVFSSVAVLAERLEKLKRNAMFQGVAFSAEVEELACCEMMSAIC